MTSPRTEIFVSWDEIQHLCTLLARDIIERGLRRDRLLAITRGGMFPAGLLARELNIKRIETIGIVTYDGMTAGEARQVKDAQPEFLKDALIVDDLVDTGTTLDFLRPLTQNCTFVTIFAKPAGKPKVDLSARDVPQESWVRFPWDTRRQFAEPLFSGHDHA